MANTWTLYCQGISFAAGKNMLGVFNGGSRVLRVRRVGMLNTQTGAVSGVVCQTDLLRLRATASWTSPTSVSPVPHDTTNSALDTVTAGHSGTLSTSGTTDTFRRILWSSDEPAASASTNDEWECFVPMNIIFDAGYGDTNVQPLVVRASEAAKLYNNSGAAGLLDSWMEFTDEAS